MANVHKLTRDHQVASYQFGAICRLLAAGPFAKLDLASVTAQIIPPVRLNQVHVCEDHRGIPTGFTSWAYLTAQKSAEFEDNAEAVLLLEDWNEGTHLWLIDVVCVRGDVRELLRETAKRALKGHTWINARRSRNELGQHLVRTRLSRRFLNSLTS